MDDSSLYNDVEDTEFCTHIDSAPKIAHVKSHIDMCMGATSAYNASQRCNSHPKMWRWCNSGWDAVSGNIAPKWAGVNPKLMNLRSKKYSTSTHSDQIGLSPCGFCGLDTKGAGGC